MSSDKLIALGKWTRRNRRTLRMALWLAESWEQTGADAELGNKSVYKPTPAQLRRSRHLKRNATRYALLNRQLTQPPTNTAK